MDGFNIVKELYTSNRQLHENLYHFSTNTTKDIKELRERIDKQAQNIELMLEQQRLILASLNNMKTLDYDKLHATNDILNKI
jgi:hypothetical protein